MPFPRFPLLLLCAAVPAAAQGSAEFFETKIRPLLVFSGKRQPAFPDVPTAAELGVKTSVPPGQNGLYAPKGLPANVKTALEKACAAAVKSEAVLKVIGNTGQSIAYLSGQQFHDQTAADYKFKGELIKRLGLGQ